MKLLAVGLVVLAIGLGMVFFTDLNTAPVFIIGVVCTLLGIHAALFPDRGPGSDNSTPLGWF